MPWSARARAAGIERMVTISTRVARQPALLAIAERFPDVYCSVGTHPHYAHEELDVTCGRSGRAHAYGKGRGDRRGRPRLSLRQFAARGAGAGLSHPYRRRARDRVAARHPFARSRRRHGAHSRRGNREGRLPGGAALLHRRPRSRAPRGRARAFRLVHRHPDVQEFARRCARSQRSCRRTASWSRPMRLISRPENFAASATSRPLWSKPQKCWPKRAASRSRRSPGRPRRISSACSQKSRVRAAAAA